MKLRKMVCCCMLLSMCITGCSDGKQEQPETAIEQQVAVFFDTLKDTVPEERNIDDLWDMLYYTEDTKRKEAFQETLIQDYEITKVEKLTEDVYVIFATLQEMDMQQEVVFYAIKEDDDWKLVFGKHNIPDVYQKVLEEQKIELPEETEVYPIK